MSIVQNFPLATPTTFWFSNCYNIKKKCCVAFASRDSDNRLVVGEVGTILICGAILIICVSKF